MSAHRSVRSSALWAAWADALGFISELTNARGLSRRLEGRPQLDAPVAWNRRVGGKFGTIVRLPKGCYSDDTQLRIATARAIASNTDGFDVEAFSKIELPAWQAYALGGGNASRAAAANLCRNNVSWFSNFYDGWHAAGGNGAAMRIQPHIWRISSGQASIEGAIRDVIVNTITTHGGPRAILGSVMHANALFLFLGEPSEAAGMRWQKVLAESTDALGLLFSVDEIKQVWLPAWERDATRRFEDAWSEVSAEAALALEICAKHLPALRGGALDQLQSAYSDLCKELNLFDPAVRGNAITTVCAAIALATALPDDPRTVAITAAAELGTDTDTIGTMAAAMAGCAAETTPEVLDGEYIAELAGSVCEDGASEAFVYPDIRHWIPPRAALDLVGTVDGKVLLAGISHVNPQQGAWPARSGTTYGWFETDFGQSMLLKHRELLKELPAFARPASHSRTFAHDLPTPLPFELELTPNPTEHTPETVAETSTTSQALSRNVDQARVGRVASLRDVFEMLGWVESKNYSDQAIGTAFRRLAKRVDEPAVMMFAAELYRIMNKR